MLPLLFISISSMPSNIQQQRKWVVKISFKIKDILLTEIDQVYKHSHSEWRRAMMVKVRFILNEHNLYQSESLFDQWK